MAGYNEFCQDISQSNHKVKQNQNKKRNKCSHAYFQKYHLSEPKEKICETLHSSACNELVATTKVGIPASTIIPFELAYLILKRREKEREETALGTQSTAAAYEIGKQPNFLHATKNAYDLFAAKMLQLSNVAIDTKYKYNKRRRTHMKTNVLADDCVSNCETPCSRQKPRQQPRSKQISAPGQSATNNFQHWPNIVGAATTSPATKLLAAPAITMHATNVAEMSTAVLRSDVSTCMCSDTITRTTASGEFASSSPLRSEVFLVATPKSSSSQHTRMPSTIKSIGKPITITKTIKTGVLSLVRNAFLMVGLLLTVLTLQRVSGQYLLSIATTTAAATTTTTEATTTRSMFAIVAAKRAGLTTTNPVSSAYDKSMYDINQIDNYNDRQASYQSEPHRKKPKTKKQSEQTQHSEQTLLPQTQWPVTDFDAHSSNRWQNPVGVLSSAATNTKYKFTPRSYEAEDQSYTGSWRTTIQCNKSFTHAPTSTSTTSRSPIHESNQRSYFSYLSTAMPKLQSAHEHNNSLIPFSKHIYNQSKKRKLFNVAQAGGRQQQLATLQRSRRSAVGSIVTQSQSNNSKLHFTSNINTEYQQQHNFNKRTFQDQLFTASAVADESTDSTAAVGIDNNSNISTNSYAIKHSNGFKDSSRNKEHNINDQKLLKLVMDGLGLQQLPNMKKVNISQHEYVTKYREYLRRVHERKRRELSELPYTLGNKSEWELEKVPLHIVSIAPNVTEYGTYTRRKRNIQDFLEDFHPNKDGETVTDNFLLPRKQRNNDGKARQKQKGRTTMILHFALEKNAAQLQAGDVEEANIRLMLIHSSALAVKSNKKKQKSKNRPCGSKSGEKSSRGHSNATAVNNKQLHILTLKVYQRLAHGKRVWLDSSKVNIELDQSHTDDTHSQWLQFDVTKAVETWLREQRSNLGLEVQCDNCQRVGVRILNDMSSPTNADDTDADDAQLMPILNIIGRLGVSYKEIRSNKHSNSAEATHHHHNVATFSNGRQRPKGAIDKHACHKANQRCCRHTMEVVFKEIKGFEFIIQPKVFDAGYCHGRCPPRYNPAHHHAMLQSLIWKQNRERAPRPCCAPSKLVELEVLHVDEKDSEKLKISTWTDMRVVECACS
ncbi:uncharacterized protein LOC105219481 [Zeugodacus cucurbitae]|nr:uncharacterized protein LOC105219481 [Zeugodacus cucurbitae]XP_028900923.1 uncharacterized protein LOC105219481 [Zeugodacus cucurbitae]XP_028900924.1 uncharacterized protein LOC105219481 [Zeugodacus cucurbitae]XP_054091349.1 uncharacterized protein LOC105219481 [Zeugodacus cucurbitae]XP_054091350.1 uncharacterized protein LOC105219481 [Zeugodacus cucurbitae]XP_054091351.1 uncharacterized protein LOC105219481 [Zeugodacus cucurbitae]